MEGRQAEREREETSENTKFDNPKDKQSSYF